MRSVPVNTTRDHRPWRSCAAALMVLLLLVLGLLGAAPGLHAALHTDEYDHCHDSSARPDDAAAHQDDTGCAVLLYAQGVTTPAPVPAVIPPAAVDHTPVFPCPAAPLLAAIPHLRPAGRAPPA